jgi:hypothetical protein
MQHLTATPLAAGSAHFINYTHMAVKTNPARDGAETLLNHEDRFRFRNDTAHAVISII